MDWAEVIQYLIEKGHKLSEVKGYTLYQVRTFYEKAMKMDSERSKSSFAMNAIASSGNGEAIKKVVGEFDKQKRREELENFAKGRS